MSFADKLKYVENRFEELGALLAQGVEDSKKYVELTREYAGLENVVAKIREYNKACEDMKQAEEMMQDADMKAIAETEYFELKDKIPSMLQEIKISMLPKDMNDDRNAILEVRGGTGGDEAALFAADLFNMYQRYAVLQGWKFEILEINENDLGGYKDASAMISGKGVFAKLKFESGGHRVQRVPVTESAGRVHTSAATVAVMPEAEEVDIEINTGDLKIDTYRASGAGGQHVNKTDSAVRITHMPTGVVVACQEERSQLQNRERAMTMLRSKLYADKLEKQNAELSSMRREQVGTGDRSDRIRTYNFPQSRVTEHRINLTLYKIDEVMNGPGLGEIIDALVADEMAHKLAQVE
jgi:peptide chain release factor 1